MYGLEKCALKQATAWKRQRVYTERGNLLCTQLSKPAANRYRVSVGDVVYVEKAQCWKQEANVEFDVIALGKEDGMVVEQLQLLKVLKLPVKFSKNGKGKRSPYSLTDPKKIAKRKMGLTAHIQRLKSLLSTHNDPSSIFKTGELPQRIFAQRTCRIWWLWSWYQSPCASVTSAVQMTDSKCPHRSLELKADVSVGENVIQRKSSPKQDAQKGQSFLRKTASSFKIFWQRDWGHNQGKSFRRCTTVAQT